MRVHDVGAEAPCRPYRVERQPGVTPSSSGALVDDGSLELVPARAELPLEVGDEDPEIRVVRPGVHLRDEEDSQREAYPRVTWRMPRHISSVVPSPQST